MNWSKPFLVLMLLAFLFTPVFAGILSGDQIFIIRRSGDGNSVIFGCPVGQALQDFNSGSGLFTCVAVGGGSGVDTNWQTSWSVFDANMKATYYTQIQSDANWNKYTLKTDFNSYLNPQSCPAGQALQILGATPTCIAVGGSGGLTDTNTQTVGWTIGSTPKWGIDVNTTQSFRADQNIVATNTVAGNRVCASSTCTIISNPTNLKIAGNALLTANNTITNYAGVAQVDQFKLIGDPTAQYNNAFHLDNNNRTGREAFVISSSSGSGGNAIWTNNFLEMAVHGDSFAVDNYLSDGKVDNGLAMLWAQGGYVTNLAIGTYGLQIPITFFTNNIRRMIIYDQNITVTNDLMATAEVSIKKNVAPTEALEISGNEWLLDNNSILLGDAKDATIKYTGVDLNINPKAVGTGKVNINGNIRVDGDYYSRDNTVGYTGTCTILGLTNFVVKNGLIVSCS